MLEEAILSLPEGYRKVQRLFEMASRFSLPVISLVDTAGAYPGIGAEERGQAEAIARSTQACLALTTPFVAVIIGEGGSGGGGGSVPTPSVPGGTDIPSLPTNLPTGGGTGSFCITPDGSTPICIPN